MHQLRTLTLYDQAQFVACGNLISFRKSLLYFSFIAKVPSICYSRNLYRILFFISVLFQILLFLFDVV